MTIVFRLFTACLLVVSLLSPRLVRAGGDLGKGPYDVGEKYYARGDYPTALQYYRKALERNDARAHYRVGLIYEDAGNDRDALTHYQSFVAVDPPDAHRGDAVRRVKAIEERQKKEAAQPTDLLERGKRLFKNKSYREAEQVLLQAASQDEARPEIHFYLGEVYMALEAYGKAESEYIKAKGYY